MRNEGEIALVQSRFTNIGPFLGAAGFVGAGVWLGLLGEASGWLVAAFFGLLLVVALIGVVRPDRLVVDDAGFRLYSYPLKPKGREYRWDEVERFLITAGGKGGPAVAFDLVSGGRQGGIKGYGRTVDELVELLSERRRLALGEPVKVKRHPPQRPASTGATGASSFARVLSLYFESPADGRRPAVVGSFLQIARSPISARRVAKRLGESLVDGTVDGETAQACVVLTVDVGPLVFLDDRIGSRVLAEMSSDHETAYLLAETITHGRLRRTN